MGFIQAAPVSGRTLRRAAAALAGTAGVSMVFGAGAASASPGSLNTSFANGGNFVHQFGLGSAPQSASGSVAVASNGDIYQVGTATDPESTGTPPFTTDLYIARYLPNGSLDPSFGNGGVAYANVAGSGGSTAIPPGGLPMAPAYVALTPSGNPIVLTNASASSGTQLAAVEFTQSGQLDPSFANNGVYEVNVGGTSSSPAGITVTAGGTIVFTGTFQDSSSSQQFFAGALTGSGQVDTSFGKSGLIEPTLGSGSGAMGEGVIAQSDGALAFDAYTAGTSGSEVAIIRTDSSGHLDTSFGTAGVAYVTAAPTVPVPPGFAVTSDGGYAIASSVQPSGSTYPETTVTRLTANGQPDTAFGTGGTAVLSLSSLIVSVPDGLVVQADGKMLITGIGAGTGVGVGALKPEPFIARIDANGTPDTSFAGGGASVNPVGGASSQTFELAAAETPDGNAVLSGVTMETGTATYSSQAFLQEVNLDTPPIVVTGADANSVQVGTPVSFVAVAVGSDGETLGQPSWDLGSGSFGDATGSTATKTFTTPGTYTVRAKVTDGFGLSAISTQTITVTPAPTANAPASTTPANTTPPNTTPANTTPANTTPASTAPANTAPTNVAPAQALAPTLRLVKLTVSHGKVRVTLLCAFAACKLNASLATHAHRAKGKSASLSASGHGKAITIASSKLSLHANQTHTFTIKLNRAGRKLLAQFRRIPAMASFKLTNTKPAKTITHKVTVR